MQREIVHQISSDDESQSPVTKRPREHSPEKPIPKGAPQNLNYLAYEMLPSTAKTLRSLLLTDGIARTARIVKHEAKVAILISFTNWEEVARFYEWSSRGQNTRSLTTAIRITCGPISNGSTAYNDAKEILEVLFNDTVVTQEDEDTEPPSGEEEQEQPMEVYDHFHFYLLHGAFCDLCQTEHRPIRPSH